MTDTKLHGPVGSHDRKGGPGYEMRIPVGIEQVLLRAARDSEFYTLLFSDREKALTESGLSLRPSERAMLCAMPQKVVQSAIQRLKPEKTQKSRFAKKVAATVAGTLLLTGAPGCVQSESAGVTPDIPQDASADTPPPASQGIQPDMPEDAAIIAPDGRSDGNEPSGDR